MAATPPASSSTYLKRFAPDVEIISEAWPKLFQPDYTEVVTKILQAKPQALYSCLWGGDLTSYIDQANIYALFTQMEVFAVNMADYTALTVVKNLPKGIHSGNRYIKTYPATPENAAWGDAYKAKYNEYPTNWSWENATAIMLIAEASKKANSADGKKIAEAMRGLKIKSPFGADGTVTMRAEDQTLVGYAIGWGTTIPQEPYVPEVQSRRLEDDLRTRSRVEEEQGLHLIDRREPEAAWLPPLAVERFLACHASGRRNGQFPLDLDALTGCLASSACLVTQTTSGLIIGMLLFLVAVGLTLIFGVLKVVNFSHGAFYMFGAYFAMTAYQLTGSFALAMLCGAAGTAILGLDLRARLHEPGLRQRRADAAAGLLCLRADLRRRRADDLGAGIQVDGNAGRLPGGAAVHRRRRGAAVLSAPDRRGAGGRR